MNYKDFLSGSLISLMDKYSVPGQKVGSDLLEVINRNDTNELIIPVLGMQGLGKSTLINAILKEDIMPSEADETTCVPVEIKYGDQTYADVYFINGEKQETAYSKQDLQKYVDNNFNPGNELGVSRIVLYRKNDLLRNGLTIVDLPGVGSLTRENEKTTNKYIENLCTAIFVLPTVPAIRKVEAMFIKSVWSQFPTAIFVQNRWTNDTPKEISESVSHNTMSLKQIAEQLNNPFDEHIIVVSAYDGIVGELQNNQEQVDASNIAELISKIEYKSQNWSVDVENALKERISNCLGYIKNRIQKEIDEISKSHEEFIRDGQERLARFLLESGELDERLNSAKKWIRKKEEEVADFVYASTKEYGGKIRAELHHVIDSGVVDGERLTEAFQHVQEDQSNELFNKVFDNVCELRDGINVQIKGIESSISLDEDVNFNPASFANKQAKKVEKVIVPVADIGGGIAGVKAGAAVGAAVTKALAAAGSLAGPLGTAAGILTGLAVTAAICWVGNKAKKKCTTMRGDSTKLELEAEISESETNFRKAIQEKYDSFFEQAGLAIRTISEQRRENENSLRKDIENQSKSSDNTELISDLNYIESVINNF